MRSSTFSLVCVLSLLPGLSIAAVPVLSTLENPFTLRAATPERWNVVFDFQKLLLRGGATFNTFVPEISLNSSKVVPQFKLTNGNLTTADGLTAAYFFGGFPALSNPPPIPLYFGDFEQRINIGISQNPPVFSASPVSLPSGGSTLRLAVAQGRE